MLTIVKTSLIRLMRAHTQNIESFYHYKSYQNKAMELRQRRQ